jgi:hypothetical protein
MNKRQKPWYGRSADFASPYQNRTVARTDTFSGTIGEFCKHIQQLKASGLWYACPQDRYLGLSFGGRTVPLPFLGGSAGTVERKLETTECAHVREACRLADAWHGTAAAGPYLVANWRQGAAAGRAGR